MPTVRRIGSVRLFFFSSDRFEPVHIHVRKDRSLAKFWLDPVSLAWASGWKEHELGRIERLVRALEPELLRAWHEHFPT